MTKTKRLITALSGHRGNRCYEYLCFAVHTAVSYQPKEPKMKDICLEVSALTGTSPLAVNKALSRAANDIWDNGNRDMLTAISGRPFAEKPSPKDLIFILAQYIWAENTSA